VARDEAASAERDNAMLHREPADDVRRLRRELASHGRRAVERVAWILLAFMGRGSASVTMKLVNVSPSHAIAMSSESDGPRTARPRSPSLATCRRSLRGGLYP
jgi:hypothetical protein